MLVIAGMAHLGVIVTGHIRENVIQQSAAAAAMYLDSFVERHVQELSTKSLLSEENRQALERLLSPASMHRPIIAFRIWKDDTVVFSNERELIGKTFARTASRERAWQGQMAAEFEQPDGDDDEQVRSLELPVLEVYAPVRERGTGRIIALVEIYEIAVELKKAVCGQPTGSLDGHRRHRPDGRPVAVQHGHHGQDRTQLTPRPNSRPGALAQGERVAIARRSAMQICR